jgi:hypothetical protein
MAVYMAAESDVAVTPVICLAGRHEAEFGEPRFLRGVWVVPVTRLLQWLQTRPVTTDLESATRVATRVMTEFPSTTTDPRLLAAMGHAALAARSKPWSNGRRTTPRSRRAATPKPSARSRRAHRSAGGNALRGLVGLALSLVAFAVLLHFLPALMTTGVAKLAEDPGTPQIPAAPTATTSPARPTAPRARPLGSPDCSTANGKQISAIVGRTVRPVASSSGCVWGSRLDDASTALVTITLTATHSAFDYQFATSSKQRRVVYGTGYDATYSVGTALWVASGQPIVRGKKPVSAQADTYVFVATKKLGVSDDRGRQLALAIAVAANASP